jgi:uncharacterized membrane protein
MPKLLGHYIHPMLIVFPLGLFVTAIVFDVIHFITGTPTWAVVSYWMIAAGIIGGLVAAIFGLLDWLGLKSASRARRVGAWHGVGNVLVVLLFAISWFMRRDNPSNPSPAAFVLVLIGGGLGLVTGWLGGELVERLAVGVDEGANPNAPSSLKTDTVTRRAG